MHMLPSCAVFEQRSVAYHHNRPDPLPPRFLKPTPAPVLCSTDRGFPQPCETSTSASSQGSLSCGEPYSRTNFPASLSAFLSKRHVIADTPHAKVMISATRRWLRRNRTPFAIGFGVIGVGYVATQYVLGKISDARERMSSDRIAREKYILPSPLSLSTY